MSLDIYSLFDIDTLMERRSESALVCPHTGLVYSVAHGVPIVLLDEELRANSLYIEKRMEDLGVFEGTIPCPKRYEAEKRSISYFKGVRKLLSFQIGYVLRRTPRALAERILRKLQGMPWRRPLEAVQRGYESIKYDSRYAVPNSFFLGIEGGRFFEWNIANVQERLLAEVVELAELNSAQRIIDVGCGFGEKLLWLAQALHDRDLNIGLYGVDMTHSRVAGAYLMHRQHNSVGQPVLFTGDARFIPYPDNYFDIGYTQYVFEVMPKKVLEHAMLEMLRVCKRAILFEPLLCIQSVFGRLYNFLFDLGGVYVDFLDPEKYEISVEEFNMDYKNNCAIVRIEKRSPMGTI